MDDRLKQFRAWDVLDGRREIFCPEESVPQDDLVFFLLDLVPQLDLSAFYAFYSQDRRGQPPFCVQMMVQLGNLSTDGTKIEANASRHKAMSYGYMTKDLERLRAEIDQLLATAAVANLAAAGIKSPRDAHGQPQLIPNTADSGYFSGPNIEGVTAAGLDPYYATGRQKHHAPEDPLTGPSAETSESPKEAMSRKLRSETGRRLYAARKHIVEPVFGQIKRVRGFRKFLLRGLELVAAEWQLICLTHNLLKIWRYSLKLG